MISNMLDYYKLLKENEINVIYSGPVWANGIESVGGLLKTRMELDELPLKNSMSVFSVFVEQMNNILMYSADKRQFEKEDGKHELYTSTGVFILGTKGKQYYLQSGNIVNESQRELISGKIEHVNSLDKLELRKYYKERLKAENDNPESRGAGLGLIEIARRASSKIEYSFEEFDEKHSFFNMYVTIG